jgi:hypothetical protein
MKMKDKMLQAVGAHAKGMSAKHKMNVDVYLDNPTGIGEHSCVVESATHELEQLGKWTDILRTLSEEYGYYA